MRRHLTRTTTTASPSSDRASGLAAISPHPLERARFLARSQLTLVGILVLEEVDEDETGDEAADVRKVRHPAPFFRSDTEGEEPIDELEHDPVTDHHPGRNQEDQRDPTEQDERANVPAGEEHQVGGKNPGDGAAGADLRRMAP